MKRRDFIKGAGAAGAVGAAALAGCSGGKKSGGPASSKRRVIWRLASSYPRSLDTIFGASETLAQAVEAMSGGRFKIRPYPAGEIVPGLQVLDAVQQDTVQVGHSASYYYTGKNPALAFETGVPFGLTARQQIAWLQQGGGDALLDPVFAEFGVKRFLGGCTGAQMGGWFNKEINSPEDIRGLKIRIPGLGGDVLSRMGATVQVLAGGDIYPALERGAIDATEWVGPYDDEKLGFHKVAKYYYYPGFWEPGPTLCFLVNRKQWQRLPDDLKAIFEAGVQVASATMLARYDALNPQALSRLKQGGTKLRAFPESVMAAAKKQAEGLYDELAAKDPTYKKILEAWRKYRAESNAWFGLAEHAYADFAFG
ncbi:MAG: TRAP transporter substrate-binding protein [Myxococcales bacterium]|jgi:TRAP-type mannitol/chloroaromatic compound transport system substrate-binding protein